jgi:SWI/SNF-related matrix-associated actin-dependent regulator of chromatin subfamily A containing DEAD/H box 1
MYIQSTERFKLKEDAYLQAGKVKVLLKLLDQYRKEGRRVLIFSQVGPL